MIQNDTEHELEQFLKQEELLSLLCFVLAGAVISGQYIRFDHQKKLVQLQNATVHTGSSTTMMDGVDIPYSNILAWGFVEETAQEAAE